jgi:hypothetical protein
VGANVLAGADAMRMIEKAKQMMQQGNGWKNPFGMVGPERGYSNF